MLNWNQFPYLRIITPFVTGIVLAIYYNKEILFLWQTGIILFLIYSLLVFFFFRRIRYKYRWISGFFAIIILLIAGYLLALYKISNSRSGEDVFSGSREHIIVQVIEQPSEKKNSYKVIAKALAVKDSTGLREVSGKILLYFQKDDSVAWLKYGDQLYVKCPLQKIKEPANPGEFNFKRYLQYKGIYYQGYIKSTDWIKLSSGNGVFILAKGLEIRNQFLEILKKNGMSGKEYAVSSAILLGYDDLLDAEQKRQFSGSGAMHILCVSGLHVGIIYVVLNSLLFFLKRNKYLRFLKLILLILLIWTYALITGFSPSVLRASTMFSFIILGRTFKRKASIYNMLAASAFFLILFDPFIITQVGFQLSYLAVTGIVMLFKPIYSLFIPGNLILDKIWQMSAVSIAATISTFPLGLYYFHQFPNLFLITNLFAIPASMLIVYTGILVITFSFVPVLSALLAKALSLIIWSLNQIVGFIEGLSFSTTSDIYISNIEFLLLFAFIASLISLALNKKTRYLIVGMSFFLLLLSSFTWRKTNKLKQQKIIVYSLIGNTAIEFIHGKQSVFLCDSSLLADEQKIDFKVNGNRMLNGINKVESRYFREFAYENEWLVKRGDFISFCGSEIFLIHEGSDIIPGNSTVYCDYVILSGAVKIIPEDLYSSVQFKEIIFDSSVPFWITKKWEEKCEQSGISFYKVSETGAWILDQK